MTLEERPKHLRIVRIATMIPRRIEGWRTSFDRDLGAAQARPTKFWGEIAARLLTRRRSVWRVAFANSARSARHPTN